MGTFCACLVARWARGTFLSSAALSWTLAATIGGPLRETREDSQRILLEVAQLQELAGRCPGSRTSALDPTFGSMHDGGPSVTTRRGQDLRAANPGGKELCAQFDSFDLRFQI